MKIRTATSSNENTELLFIISLLNSELFYNLCSFSGICRYPCTTSRTC